MMPRRMRRRKHHLAVVVAGGVVHWHGGSCDTMMTSVLPSKVGIVPVVAVMAMIDDDCNDCDDGDGDHGDCVRLRSSLLLLLISPILWCGKI